MKITPDRAIQRAEQIARLAGQGTHDAVKAEVLKVIEEATGAKLPEPFDESLVKHLSVWQSLKEETAVLFIGRTVDEELMGVFLRTFTASNYEFPRSLAEEHARRLKEGGYRYIGQYDFHAGLPKEKGGAK